MKLLQILLDTYREEFDLNINESLTKTVELGQTVSILSKKFPNWIFQHDRGRNDFTIEILRIKDGILVKDFKTLLPLLNNLGWFISYHEIYGKDIEIKNVYNQTVVEKAFENKDVHSIYLECEAKFDLKVNKIPKVLYHITPTQNWEKIQVKGLVPKSRSKASYHPDRVFLAKTEKYAEDLGERFYQITGTKNWTLLKINTDQIPSYFRLYKDPNYLNRGFYTMNNVPPYAIEKVKDIEL